MQQMEKTMGLGAVLGAAVVGILAWRTYKSTTWGAGGALAGAALGYVKGG